MDGSWWSKVDMILFIHILLLINDENSKCTRINEIQTLNELWSHHRHHTHTHTINNSRWWFFFLCRIKLWSKPSHSIISVCVCLSHGTHYPSTITLKQKWNEMKTQIDDTKKNDKFTHTHWNNQRLWMNVEPEYIKKNTHTHTVTNKQTNIQQFSQKKSQKPICLCMCVCLADDDLFFSNVIHKYPQHTNWNH